MRELRIQSAGRPYRVHEVNVPRADALYDEHLRALEEEGLI